MISVKLMFSLPNISPRILADWRLCFTGQTDLLAQDLLQLLLPLLIFLMVSLCSWRWGGRREPRQRMENRMLISSSSVSRLLLAWPRLNSSEVRVSNLIRVESEIERKTLGQLGRHGNNLLWVHGWDHYIADTSPYNRSFPCMEATLMPYRPSKRQEMPLTHRGLWKP